MKYNNFIVQPSLFDSRTSISYTIDHLISPVIIHALRGEQPVVINANTKSSPVCPKLENGDLFVNHIWPGCIALADYLSANPNVCFNKKVLELGAGCALPSITAYKLKAQLVVCSDYPNQTLLSHIEWLRDLNGCNDMIVSGYCWGDDSQLLVEGISKENEFDLILLADVLWKDTYSQHRNLLYSIKKYLSPIGQALLTLVHRECEIHSREKDLEFFSIAGDEFNLSVSLLETFNDIYTDALENEPVVLYLYALRHREYVEGHSNINDGVAYQPCSSTT